MSAPAASLTVLPPANGQLRHQIFDHTRDFVYMWWANGYRDPSAIVHTRTSVYGASFDLDGPGGSGDFLLRKLGPLPPGTMAEAVLTEPNDVVEDLPDAGVTLSLISSAGTFPVVRADPGLASAAASFRKPNFMVVESGRLFERRWIEQLIFGAGAPEARGHFEIAAWPDRLGLGFYVTPAEALSGASLSITIRLGARFSNLFKRGGTVALTDGQTGPGFVMLGSSPAGLGAATLSCHAPSQRCVVKLAASNWPANQERFVGLVLYPFHANAALEVERIDRAENGADRVVVSATNLEGPTPALQTTYDRLHGWHKVRLTRPAFGKVPARVDFTLRNPSNRVATARVAFEKVLPSASFAAIATENAVITDRASIPVGLPVQVSKNFHADLKVWRVETERHLPAHRFSAGEPDDLRPWLRAFAMLKVPPRSELQLRFVEIGGYWGNAPAAALTQLSLIGWGGHQLWDQSSIGAQGENITFDPDQNLVECFMCDVRPMLVTRKRYAANPPGTPGWEADGLNRAAGFTNNIGAMDILLRKDAAGQRQPLGNVRVYRKRVGPNLTEAIYAGETPDGAIATSVTTRLFRSNDLVRLVLNLRHDVRAPIPVHVQPPPSTDFLTQPNRLAFFQLGAEFYNTSRFGELAIGDRQRLVARWSPPSAQDASWWHVYSRTGIPMTGVLPWFSQHASESRAEELDGQGTYGAWGNRGLLIRSYDSRLAGVRRRTPVAAVYGTRHAEGSRGVFSSSNMELSIPGNVTQLEPGDFVDTELVYLSVPQRAHDYLPESDPAYPNVPNRALRAALATPGVENSWRPVQREASGMVSWVTTSEGQLEDGYPIRIRTASNRAEVSIQGGMALVPVTFTGLTTYKGLVLERVVQGSWQRVDQSIGGTGTDFWQTDYDPEQRRWELTFNVDLDRADRTQPVRVRLRPAGGA